MTNGATKGTLMDELHFRALSLYEQFDALPRYNLAVGNKAVLPFMLLHLVWAGLQVGVVYIATHLNGGVTHERLFKNSVCAYYLFDFLGVTGMFQGPLLGQVKNPFVMTRHRFTPGTLKEPFFSSMGDKRTLLDVVVSCLTVVACCTMIWAEEPTAHQTCAYALCVAALFITDFGGYVGSTGQFHGPMAMLLLGKSIFGNQGYIAACQTFLLLVYVGCGLGKMGPWFACVFVQEWTMPPWFNGSKLLQRIFYKDVANDDFTPSSFGFLLSYAAATYEWAMPLLLLVTPEVATSTFGVDPAFAHIPAHVGAWAMVAMHVYIIAHLPLADVNILNIVPAYWCWYTMLYVRAPACGFDYAGLALMPLPMKLFLVGLAAFSLFGQLRPDLISYALCYRFWAGNWPQGWYLITKEGKAKLSKVKTFGSFAADEIKELKVMPSDWEVDVTFNYRVLGAMWLTQLCMRGAPAIFHKVLGPKRTLVDVDCYFAMFFNQWVAGIIGNDALRSLHLLPRLQRVCEFSPGECTYVRFDSFRLFGTVCKWQIIDAAKGVLESGSLTRAQALRISCPSKVAEVLKLE